MRLVPWFLCVVFSLSSALAQAPPQLTAEKPKISKSDLKQAEKDYKTADKFIEEKRYEEASHLLDDAVTLVPTNADYANKREMVRQQLVTMHIERGNASLTQGKTVEAIAEFRQALAIDPKNEFALQRVQDALPARAAQLAPEPLSHALQTVAENKPIVLAPLEERKDFHFRGFSRNLLEQICNAYGIKAMFDDSVTGKTVRFDIENADFFSAIYQAEKQTHVFFSPLTSKSVIFANDTQALRRTFERMLTKTFYINEVTTPQELNDVVNLMRTIFDIRFVSPQPSDNSIVVRAPAEIVDAAETLLNNFLSRKPQVTLEVAVYQISHSATQQIGIQLPLSFQAIYLGADGVGLLTQGNNQDLINQLISSGAINQANSEALQAILAQLQSQNNSAISSLLNTPFGTFGGGQTMFAVPIPPTTVNLSLNESDVKSLSRLTLRAGQGNAATVRLGSRYPIINATFSPISNSNALTQVLANQSFVAPFPSFTYEDLGLTVKATPQVMADRTVTLKIELQVKSLTGQAINGVPVISNREFTGTMSLMDAQPAMVAGYITKSEQKTLTGIPGIAFIPGLGHATSNRSTEYTDDELLVMITPYIVSPARQGAGNEVWLPAM